MIDEKLTGMAEKALMEELATITGSDLHVKTAGVATPAGERASMVKKASHVKRASDVSITDLLNDENFKRGLAEAIDSRKGLWEQAIVERLLTRRE
jgi:hypothetical protein